MEGVLSSECMEGVLSSECLLKTGFVVYRGCPLIRVPLEVMFVCMCVCRTSKE